MKTYKEYKSELKLLKEERNKLQKEIFSNETKKLSKYIGQQNNNFYKILNTTLKKWDIKLLQKLSLKN
jgi:hypothetical protein